MKNLIINSEAFLMDSKTTATLNVHFGNKAIEGVISACITTSEKDGLYIEDYQGDYSNISSYVNIVYVSKGYAFLLQPESYEEQKDISILTDKIDKLLK